MTAYFRKFSPAFSSVNGGSLHMNVAPGRCIGAGAIRRLAAVAVAVAVGLEGCSSASSTDRRTLIDSRDTYDPRSLDPAMSTDVPTGRAVGYLFDGLTTLDASANVKPGLATRWDVSPDGKRYVFHLRPGVRFHDGTPLTARQVAASWKRVLDPKTKAGGADPLYPILGAREFSKGAATEVAGIQVRDDSTLSVTLAEPLAVFPKLLAMPVASVVPENATDLAAHPIGTGPWKLVEWKHDDYLLFARNDQFWGGKPAAESLRARIIAEPSTAVAEFESGNVDVLQIPAVEAREWTEDESRKPRLASVPALQLIYIGINTTRGPLVDARVRQAINYAIDVPRIIDRLVGGRGLRAAGVIPPSLPGYDSSRAAYPYDPAKAKALLAQSGHASDLTIDLWCSTFPLYVRIAETVQ